MNPRWLALAATTFVLAVERGTHSFAPRRADGEIRDTAGRRWRTRPDALVSETGARLARVPAHRAFWFGWIAQHPETVLFK